MFILHLFSSFTANMVLLASRDEEGLPSREELKAKQALLGLPAPAAGGLGKFLDLELRQLGSVGGPPFKVSSP